MIWTLSAARVHSSSVSEQSALGTGTPGSPRLPWSRYATNVRTNFVAMIFDP
jgi:hypothetical protein